MKAFLIGFVIGLAVIPVGGYFYFSHGMAPAATNAKPMPYARLRQDSVRPANVASKPPACQCQQAVTRGREPIEMT
ncbi:MAG TPA: hypothetical protein VMW38_19815 [Terriglobia bacterium]|nr:hypothetical protein [Terriglobia bacterium]